MFIVLDIGGTFVRLALMNEKSAKIEKFAMIKVKDDYPKDLAAIANKYLDWTQEYNDSGKELTLSIGAAGIAGAFDVENKKLVKAVHLSSWQLQNLEGDFFKIFNCPFRFRNDTYLAIAGAIKITQMQEDFWYVNWGSGIGGALAIDLKNCKAGWHYQFKSSEIGHASIAKNGLPCSCGQIGCWDAYCGGNEIEKRYSKQLADLTQEEWRPIFNDMAQGLLNLYVSYPTDVIVLNGGVIQHQKERLEFLQELLADKLKIFEKQPQLVLLNQGENAGIIGAWLLIFGVLEGK